MQSQHFEIFAKHWQRNSGMHRRLIMQIKSLFLQLMVAFLVFRQPIWYGRT